MRERLAATYESRIPLLEELARRLEAEVRAAIEPVDHVDAVYFRRKGTDSFVDKALNPDNKPPYDNPLREIEDQVAGRVLVLFMEDIEAVTRALSGLLRPIEAKNRRPRKDSEFGYESFHLVSTIPPHCLPRGWDLTRDMPSTFELQVRTLFMHAYAEPEHKLRYKSASDLPREIRRELAWVAASAWGSDRALQRVLDWTRGST